MANLFSNPSHTAHIGYNGFDMDNVLKFTSTTGELLPVYYDILQPGDKVTCSTELRTRTMPLRTAAMAKITERVEWFFVPMRYIFSLFNDWYYGINDNHSSIFYSANFKSQLPYIPGSDFVGFVQSIFSSPVNDWMFSRSPETGLYNKNTSLRVMEMLGIPVGSIYNNTVGSAMMSVCPLFACAYQKIFYDYYRLTDRLQNNPAFYNLDAFYSNPAGIDLSVTDLFTLRYRPRYRDFFTSLYTSPLMGNQSINSWSHNNSSDILDLTNSFSQWLASGLKLQTSDSAGAVSSSSNKISVKDNVNPTQINSIFPFDGVGTHSPVVYNNLSPTQIRTSFAVQKLLEITRRAGKHWDAQTLAHFGVKVPKNLAGEVVFLGKSTESDIEIGDVISTADTDNGDTGMPLGEIGGKGYNYGRPSTCKYEASEHGILMAIYSAEVCNDYSAQTQYDRLNTLIDRSSWPTPEFDNLGMQPLFLYQYKFIGNSSSWSPVMGWQYRWSEFKTKYNRVCGALSRSMSDWTTLQHFKLFTIGGGMPAGDFYCSPFDLDTIMQKPYEFGYADNSSLFDSDPLIHMINFNVKKASKMSTYGLETL